jgi:phosphoglycerol transferase MdoB-like AlkP superfamily enzyme
MSDYINTKSREGVGFFGLLFITFLVLKLTNVIDWSWWWVTAPLWGGFAIGVIIFVLIGIAILLVNAINNSSDRKS